MPAARFQANEQGAGWKLNGAQSAQRRCDERCVADRKRGRVSRLVKARVCFKRRYRPRRALRFQPMLGRQLLENALPPEKLGARLALQAHGVSLLACFFLQ